jgi:Subtilase family
MDPALHELLRGEEAVEDRVVEAIIRFRRPGVEVPGVRIVAPFGEIATCRLAIGSVGQVRAHANEVSLKAARPLGPEYETSGADRRSAGPPKVRPTDTRRGPGLPLTGAGVVVGVVDWGMDFDHPNFKASDGTTRLLALWDQRPSGSGQCPQPYGYGTLHEPGEINRALGSADPYGELGYHPGTADRGGGSHGTHVLDIAAGNGRAGGPAGVAPDAELVFVHLADRDTGGLANLGDSVRLLEAVDFVRRTAGDRPWVVNVSVGRHGGPHDGTTLIELAFDALLSAAPGRFIVQSTGNYFRSRTHASGRLRQGQVETLSFVTDPADTSVNELEIWYDGADELVVRLDPPDGGRGSPVRLGSTSGVLAGGQVVGMLYHRAHDPNNGDNHVDAFLFPNGHAGTWTVALEAERVRSGRFHAWLERDEVCEPCQARFITGDIDPACTTGTIANSRVPLVVGAYDAHSPSRPMAAFSSSGPTRDDRWKPDLAAPGKDILAARSAELGRSHSPGGLVCKSGTSMATPHVTGAVALCLEAGGHRLDARTIRALVLDTAQPHTANGSGHRLGRGYLDIPSLVSAVQAAFPPPAGRHERKNGAMDAHLDTSQGLALAPAKAYRELLYRPRGGVSTSIEKGFDVVARPGQRVSDPPRAGDVILQVSLGRPGAGSCSVLLGSGLARQRASGDHGAPGWYARARDPVKADGGPFRLRLLDASGCVPPGQLLLRPRSTDLLDEVDVEHDFDEDDAEARTPVPVDLAAAVPPFAPAERARVLRPLLSAQASERAVAWSRRMHPATSGVTLDEIRDALATYVDASAVQAALGGSGVTADAVLVECVHQFQVKCYVDPREHDGHAGESTLDSLGLIARIGSGLRHADRGNASAQERLRSRDRDLGTATGDEFSAANWFDRMADPSVFGVRTKLGNGLHVVLLRKLRRAERHLLTLPAFRGRTPAGLGTALGLTEKHGGARPSQTQSTSVHTFGLAIDIAYRGNPWVRRAASWEALRRAASLVSGVGLSQSSAPAYFSSLGSDAARSTGQIWDEIQRRNAELIAYMALGNDDASLRAALLAAQARGTVGAVRAGESLDDAVTRWGTRIRQDRQALSGGDFDNHEPPGRGFLTHSRDLVVALRDHGCLAWGAVDLGPGALGSGDMMHYDARVDGAGRVLTRNTRAFIPSSGHPCLPAAAESTDEEEGEGRVAPHVLEARKAWGELFPTLEIMKRVQILDLTRAPSKAIAGSGLSAWTNSAVRIYVAKADGADSAYWKAVLFHESLHVRQFLCAGGRPPGCYATMMRYECDAYGDAHRWAAAHKSEKVRAYSEDLKKMAKLICDEIAAAEKATQDPAMRRERYRKFLLGEKLLPPHRDLAELYTPAGDLRNPAAAEWTEGDAESAAEEYAESAEEYAESAEEYAESAEEYAESDEESAAGRAKDAIRAGAKGWGTDEAAVMSALRGLLPSQMAELSADGSIVDLLRDELSGAELAAAGGQLARGRVGSMARVDVDRVLAAPNAHSLGTLAAAIARDVLLGHQEAFDSTGTGTIHGSRCPGPRPAGTTSSDCTEYVKDVLSRALAAKGQSSVWTGVLREATTRSGAAGLKGTEVMKALQRMQGWEALFWAPDPLDTADGQSEHPYAYRIVRTKGTYYGITVDQAKSVINYRRTNAANPTDLTGIERLRRLQFGVLAARGGTHMALIVNGSVHEVHWSSPATDRNAIEATPLESFVWQSGAIAAPPGDLGLAWRTP